MCAVINKLLVCNNRVAQAYLNEKKLDHEARQLQQNAANFSRQAQQVNHTNEITQFGIFSIT